MRRLALMLLLVLAAGCGVSKDVSVRDAEVKDIVRSELRTNTRLEVVPVFVKVAIPEIRELRRNLRDSLDVIENDYSVSTVVLHPDGSFDHGLETKPQVLEEKADATVKVTDSSFVNETYSSDIISETVTVTETVNVLKWWQKTLMWLGAALMAAMLAKMIFKLIK